MRPVERTLPLALPSCHPTGCAHSPLVAARRCEPLPRSGIPLLVLNTASLANASNTEISILLGRRTPALWPIFTVAIATSGENKEGV